MKWLLVTLDFPPTFIGGIASWVWDLAHALHEAGEAVTVLAKGPGEDHLPFPVVRMHGRSWSCWQGLWAALYAGPVGRDTTVVAATWRLATVLAPFVRGRLLVAAHGSDLSRLRGAPPAFRRVARRADGWLPVSRFLAGELARLGVPDAQPLPWPLRVNAPRAAVRHGLVCAARLTALKGIDRAIRLARSLDEPLTVVGDGPERFDAPDVRFTGRLDRTATLAELARARAAVLLPRVDADGTGAEGLGLVLLEAAALGTPAIGCRTGGVPEAVGPGLLVDPDRPDLDAVRALLADPLAGERARAWVTATHNPTRTLAALGVRS